MKSCLYRLNVCMTQTSTHPSVVLLHVYLSFPEPIHTQVEISNNLWHSHILHFWKFMEVGMALPALHREHLIVAVRESPWKTATPPHLLGTKWQDYLSSSTAQMGSVDLKKSVCFNAHASEICWSKQSLWYLFKQNTIDMKTIYNFFFLPPNTSRESTMTLYHKSLIQILSYKTIFVYCLQ